MICSVLNMVLMPTVGTEDAPKPKGKRRCGDRDDAMGEDFEMGAMGFVNQADLSRGRSSSQRGDWLDSEKDPHSTRVSHRTPAHIFISIYCTRYVTLGYRYSTKDTLESSLDAF